jgi:hypothetical protein
MEASKEMRKWLTVVVRRAMENNIWRSEAYEKMHNNFKK